MNRRAAYISTVSTRRTKRTATMTRRTPRPRTRMRRRVAA
jgi:hypothetical protein